MTARRSAPFLALLLLVFAAAAALRGRPVFVAKVQQHLPQATPAQPSALSAMLPRGALLTIESPDFATLLHRWTTSPESAAWLKSANYSVFSNSRLFGRLSAAQDEFASTAKLDAAGTSLLEQVAGAQSIFAWYDIGQLQFLYITRMPAGRAQQGALFAQRASFQRRQVGATEFYVRSETVSGSTRQRTVAFATVGDLLLLSTREDLMAGALHLLATPGAGSLAAEPWYTEAAAAQPQEPAAPALHMVLALDRIVPTPYFRSYWIQGNVSEFTQYRTAVSDLYLEQDRSGPRFREERTLLLKDPAQQAPDPDLGALAALVPPGTGVYRAQSVSDPQAAVALLNEKLLTRATDTAVAATYAPDPSLAASPAGDSADLETRIDTPPPVSASSSGAALVQMLDAAGLQATLTLDTAAPTSGTWVPLHAAVVLRTARPLAPDALATALQQLLRGTLTASTLGIQLVPSAGNPAIRQLSGPKPLFLAQSGTLTLFSDDLPMLTAMLTRVSQPAPSSPAVLLAGFDHLASRAPLTHLATLIDTSGNASSDQAPADNTPATPAFFSGNLRSLSDTLARVASQQVTVRHQGNTLHQTVLYQWQP